ncbi:FecCD family ABC transporter permease [Rhodococcus sp. NBC_00294]|uniref:FecCD family ABC transporter permease n=1 Tax=Rhodococcus sp. NBC_00294 TaxID=2976004 RepID=UPI002E2B3ED8|nr:iron ABC transporter permease [Rhodococcus sp. NBC_00294]
MRDTTTPIEEDRVTDTASGPLASHPGPNDLPEPGTTVRPDRDYSIADADRRAPGRVTVAAASAVDVGVVLLPLVLGLVVVRSLADDNGGGQVDRAVFGVIAVLAAAGVLVWNRGFRDGRAGQSVGKSLFALVLRDAETGDAVGVRPALTLRRKPGVETVRLTIAVAEDFEPVAPDTSSAATRRRRTSGLIILVAAIVLVALMSVAVGARPLTFAEIFHALFSATGTDTDVIVRSLRLPRTILGLVVGIALGVAGALIQGHTRNPLADAGLLGLNAGAAFFVVMAIYLFGITSPGGYLWFAFAGAATASIVVFGTASLGGARANPLSLALAGAAIAFFLQAMTNAVVLLDQTTLDSYRFWVVGSVSGRGPDIFWTVLPFIVIGLIIAVAGTPALNTISLGDDVARSLGTNITLTRVVGIVAITLLTGAATAACGPVAFVGLVVPHIARAITGPDYRWLLPFAGALGGVLLVLADVIGRVVVRPGELQVGIVLALIGAPFFIALVRRRTLVSL